MNDYKTYKIDIEVKELTDYIKLSNNKFHHIFGRNNSTDYYYMYNFFSIASCNQHVYKLYTELLRCIRDYTTTHDQLWLQSWINLHTKDQVLQSHSHDFPIHGYISITDHKTTTVFTDSHNGNIMYEIQNQPGQIYIGPGFRYHHVRVDEDFDDERITLGFDLQTSNMISENFSFIPIVL
jgi:hypothetical protein